jgi:hypothetical protein
MFSVHPSDGIYDTLFQPWFSKLQMSVAIGKPVRLNRILIITQIYRFLGTCEYFSSFSPAEGHEDTEWKRGSRVWRVILDGDVFSFAAIMYLQWNLRFTIRYREKEIYCWILNDNVTNGKKGLNGKLRLVRSGASAHTTHLVLLRLQRPKWHMVINLWLQEEEKCCHKMSLRLSELALTMDGDCLQSGAGYGIKDDGVRWRSSPRIGLKLHVPLSG